MILPYETNLNNRLTKLFPHEDALEAYGERYPNQTAKLGMMVVFLFRHTPEQDYIKTYIGEEQIITYDQREFAIWVGGVALNDEDRRILHLSNREKGSFEEHMGWRPLLAVKDKPSPAEEEMYITYETSLIDQELEHLGDE